MSLVSDARRTIARTADAATATAGAVGGAVVTGTIGAVEGTAAGVKNGLKTGSRSTPTAALTLAAIGVAGLVDWPVLLAGAAALAIHELSRLSNRTQRHAVVDGGETPQTPRPRATSKTPKGAPRA